VPPLLDVTTPVVFTAFPAVVLVTCTVTVQVPPTATVPVEKARAVSPAAGAKVGVPHPVVVAAGGVATWSPVGNVSLTATPVRATVLSAGLVSVSCNVLVPPVGMLAGRNALLIVGGLTSVKVKAWAGEAPAALVAVKVRT